MRLIDLGTILQFFLVRTMNAIFPTTCSVEQLTLHAYPVEIWRSLAIGKYLFLRCVCCHEHLPILRILIVGVQFAPLER